MGVGREAILRRFALLLWITRVFGVSAGADGLLPAAAGMQFTNGAEQCVILAMEVT
jgi:hypothetical protein